MRRREFMALLSGAAAAWPLAARAQQAERMRRIGILADEQWPPIDSLKQGLRNLGYVEGQNLEIVYRFAAAAALPAPPRKPVYRDQAQKPLWPDEPSPA